MPNAQDHTTQADRNKQFLEELQRQNISHKDWLVTIAFYVAVHRIEAYLSGKMNFHSTEHKVRNGAMAKVADLKPIYGDYQELYNMSMDSRYNCVFTKWSPAEINRIVGKLTKIESYLTSLG